MKNKIFVAFVLASCALSSIHGYAQNLIAITGGKLLTVSHGTIENGVLVIEAGKIVAVGKASEVSIKKGTTIVDARGLTVYPGLFDPDTNLGLVEVGSNKMANDLLESSDEILPQMHVYDAFHAESELISVARLNGVTNAVVAPGIGDTLAGQDALIQLTGQNRDAMILGRDIALTLNYGSEERRREGTRAYPTTRMGVIAQLRQALLDAQQYETAQTAAAKKDTKKDGENALSAKRDLKFEALLPYLHGEKPVVIEVSESYEAQTIMKVALEFNLKVVLKGMTHTQDILDEIASWNVPVIFGSIYDQPRANERYDAVFTMPYELSKRGVKIALSSASAGHPGSSYYVRNLPYEAGTAVAYGLPYDVALRAITLNVADIFGVADKFGSLDVGKAANVVLANGDPLDVRTDVRQVYVNGIAQPMVSRQTQLRDAYSK
jgi:imidazolonepropionase-like amidohydrolase